VILWAARAWVRRRSAHYHSTGEPLSPADLEWALPFHEPALLDGVRLSRVPLHVGRIAAITYGASILISPDAPSQGLAWHRLLFHELVHVAQYRALGIDAFIDRYLRGWAAGGYRYRAIGLEVDAYAIEARFASDPGRHFSVRAEVERRLAVSGER
jgi:hypothetical protein